MGGGGPLSLRVSAPTSNADGLTGWSAAGNVQGLFEFVPVRGDGGPAQSG